MRSLGLMCSLAGGVVGGVMGSSAVGLDWGEESSVIADNGADSALGLIRAREVRLLIA